MGKTRVRFSVMSKANKYQAQDHIIALIHVVILMAKIVQDLVGLRGVEVCDRGRNRIEAGVRDPLKRTKEVIDPGILATQTTRAINHKGQGLKAVATTVALPHGVPAGVARGAQDPAVLADAGIILPEVGALDDPLSTLRRAIDLRDLILRGVLCQAKDPIRAATPDRLTKNRAVFDPRDHHTATRRKDPIGLTRVHIWKKEASQGAHLW